MKKMPLPKDINCVEVIYCPQFPKEFHYCAHYYDELQYVSKYAHSYTALKMKLPNRLAKLL